MRKGRLLLALRAVKHARALAGKDNPTVHCMLVRVCKALAEVKAGGPAAGGGQDRAAQGAWLIVQDMRACSMVFV